MIGLDDQKAEAVVAKAVIRPSLAVRGGIGMPVQSGLEAGIRTMVAWRVWTGEYGLSVTAI